MSMKTHKETRYIKLARRQGHIQYIQIQFSVKLYQDQKARDEDPDPVGSGDISVQLIKGLYIGFNLNYLEFF